MDVSRLYGVNTIRFCSDCEVNRWELTEFLFSFYPDIDSLNFKDIEIEDFYKKGRVLDQKWFDETNLDEIYKTLKGAEDVYLVDTGYLMDGKYVLLKVNYYSGEFEIDN